MHDDSSAHAPARPSHTATGMGERTSSEITAVPSRRRLAAREAEFAVARSLLDELERAITRSEYADASALAAQLSDQLRVLNLVAESQLGPMELVVAARRSLQ